MQALEYYFNPKLRKDTRFRVFEFRPEDSKKEYLGNLYLIIEHGNVLPKNDNLLEDLTDIIRDEFYANPKRLPEIALKEALKKGNQFLNRKAEDGDVSWLGNLNIAVLNISNFFLHFSRAGNVKVSLLRGDELTDIAQGLDHHINNLPLKFFPNVATGRLTPSDKIIILTQELFEAFYDEILPQIINLPEINDKTLRKFFRERKKEMKNWFGIFFLISVEQRKRPFNLNLRLPAINKTLLLILFLSIILLVSFLLFRYGR